MNWALLGLVIERPSYAYELARRFERVYEGALALSSVSHVYTALSTLRERELVTEVETDALTLGAKRRYEATPTGIAEHTKWLIEQVAEERRRQRVLVAQLGALAQAPERALAVLDSYEQAYLTEARNAPAPGADEGPGATRLVARLLGEETRQSMAAKLRWAHYARLQLQAHRVSTPPPQP